MIERLLDLGKDAGMAAVQIGDRLPCFLDQAVTGIEQLERDRNDGVGENIHRWALAAGKRLAQYIRGAERSIHGLHAIIVLPHILQASRCAA